MYKYGLKLWSINENYVNAAISFFEQGYYDYIELYAVPNSYEQYITLWEKLEIPYVIHAPHFMHGLCLSKKEAWADNSKVAQETFKFADRLNAETIIFHPGIAGNIEETVNQLNKLNDNRISIENKPYYAVFDKGKVCNGNSPEEIKLILENTNVNFCLDIGHCFCSANARNINQFEYLKQFLELNPKIFHLTDGHFESVWDRHDHYGNGDYDLPKILNFIPKGYPITIETFKDYKDNLNDFLKDINFLKSLFDDFNIKKASEEDLLDIFNLSNEYEVRQNSFEQELIELEEHIQWYNSRLTNEDCIFYVAKSIQNDFIGYSRFDKKNDKEFIITVHVSPEYRLKGNGSKLIMKTSDMVLTQNKNSKIIACVKENNFASIQAFKKAGYTLVNKCEVKGNSCFKLLKT